MKNFLLSLSAFIISFSALSQTQFQRVIGTKSGERNYHLASTKAGHFIATGYTNSVSGNGDDAFLVKINRLGKVQWSFTYGDTGDDYSWDVNVLNNNDILACGYTSSFGTPKSAATLTRLDSNGTVIWLSAIYTSTLGVQFYKAHETSTGHILASGLMQSASNGDQMVLAKFTSKGYLLWLKTIGTSGSDEVMGLTETSSGHYLLAGLANDANGYGSSDFAVVKTDTAGRLVWSKIYGGSKSERLNSVIAVNGSYYFSGWSSSVGQGDNDIVLMKTDTAGKVDWVNAYGSNRSELCFNMLHENESNSLILAGYTEKFSKTGQTDNRNSLLLKINAGNGNLKWSESYGGSNRDGHWPTGLASNGNDKGYFLLGSTNTFATGDYDLYFVKTDTSGQAGCNQKSAQFRVSNISGWSGKSFGVLSKPTVVFTKTTLSGSKWSLNESTECCNLFINPGLGDTLCPAQSAVIGSKSINGYNYEWYNGANKVASSATYQVDYGEGADYTLIVSANAPGCATKSAKISVLDDVKPTTNANVFKICEGDSGLFVLRGNLLENEWFSLAQNTLVGTDTAKHWKFTDTLIWIAKTKNECTFTDSVFMYVSQFPKISLIDSASYCQGDSVFVNANSSHTFKWEEYEVSDTGIWLSSEGYYKVSSYNNNQCGIKDSVWVYSLENPKITMIDSISFCEGDSAFVSLTANYPYQWLNTNIIDAGRWVSKNQFFTVIARNEHCATRDSVLSIVNLNPKPDLGLDFDTCYNTQKCFYFEPSFNQTYWNGTRTSRDTFCALPGGQITVMVVDNNGCMGYDSIEFGATNTYVNLIEADTIWTFIPMIEIGVESGEWSTYNWTGKNISSDNTEKRIRVETDGWYYVKAIDKNGCSETDSVFVAWGIGILEKSSQKISLFPNPANSSVFVISDLFIESVSIYSVSGQLIKEFSSNHLNITSLPEGLYLVKVEMDGYVAVKQLIISR